VAKVKQQADDMFVITCTRDEAVTILTTLVGTEKSKDILAAFALATPAEKSYDPLGQITCHVDPACKWTGKSLARARVHATWATLQSEGHIAR
jgi:hypothetical protein